MGIKTKALGNALANKLRGFEDKTSEMVSPGNTPAPPDLGAPPAPPVEEAPMDGAAPVMVPPDAMPDAVEGDTYTVEAVGPEGITLVKQPGAAPETAAPMPPL